MVLLRFVVVLLFALIACHSARSENVDLSTVPKRDTVQLTIYNSEDLTLVRETRVVTFKQGLNPLQFSWANTLIDPSSVELRFLTPPDKLTCSTRRSRTTSRRCCTGTSERDRRRGHDPDHVLHQRHHLDGRLHRHRGRRRVDDGCRGLCPRLQQQRRGVRRRPGAAGRRHDQPRREDRRIGSDRRRRKYAHYLGINKCR